jgi:hypothetical protein
MNEEYLIKRYPEIVQIMKGKNNEIVTTIDEFVEKGKKVGKVDKIIIKYKASCGHIYEMLYGSYRMGGGNICLDCSNKINHAVNEDRSAKGNSLEYRAIKYLETIMDKRFTVQIVEEGCLADMAIKLKSCNDDSWTQIQVKSTGTYTTSTYNFQINKKYPDCVILCISMIENDKRVWLFDDKTDKTIKISKKSKYNKNEVKFEELNDKLEEFMKITPHHNSKDINTPIAELYKKEREYREHLISKCNFLIFKRPEGTNLKHDFLINDIKFQDKLLHYKNKNINYLTASLGKGYEKGDNDYYLFHFPNKSGFMLIPEQIMINDRFVSLNKEKVKTHFYHNINIRNYDDYIYYYNDEEFETKTNKFGKWRKKCVKIT